LNLDIKLDDLDTNLPIVGDHKSWRTKIEDFCSKQSLDVKRLIAAAVRLLHPEALKSHRNKKLGEQKLQKAVRATQTKFALARQPEVPDFLRRLVAHLMELLRQGHPLPIVA
jgi:hypothetical protein